jgi:16S rRNA (cytosine967-C5)-methyltransferase
MSRYHSYLNSAVEILKQYKGEEPFASFLKKFFSLHKKYGSKDRKTISHLCYCFFRLGKMNIDLPVEEKILAGLFLCSNVPNEILKNLKPEWEKITGLVIREKFSILHFQFLIPDVFPWKEELSEGMDHKKFSESFFVQPDLFLRLRPGNEEKIKKKLKAAGISFETISDNCVALSNSSKLDSVIELNKEAVVQDYSSQRTGEFLSLVRRGPSDKVWDCCAGSGGKSIMLYDLYPDLDLTVSDIRKSIIVNLEKRFSEAGITKYKTIVADLTGSDSRLPTPDFRVILADVPCTGSGTWGRTPEQLFYFDKEKISEFVSLQRKIVSNIIPHLQPGGYLLYITCSVFKKENEDMVKFMKENFHLQIIKMETLKGYDKKADTMFAALLKKVL